MGFCNLHRRLQIHTEQRLKPSVDLKRTVHQISSVQHCWSTQVHVWWNHGLSTVLTRWPHWPRCVPWNNSDWCEIWEWDPSSICPYASAIGNYFILMNDNARPHRIIVVEEYLFGGHSLERLEWADHTPDLNLIEHLWNLGRQSAALSDLLER